MLQEMENSLDYIPVPTTVNHSIAEDKHILTKVADHLVVDQHLVMTVREALKDLDQIPSMSFSSYQSYRNKHVSNVFYTLTLSADVRKALASEGLLLHTHANVVKTYYESITSSQFPPQTLPRNQNKKRKSHTESRNSIPLPTTTENCAWLNSYQSPQ